MILRICDNGNEHIEPASPARVDEVLAPSAPIADGTEITVADGERWLTAMVVGPPGTPAELLASGAGAAGERVRFVQAVGALDAYRAA